MCLAKIKKSVYFAIQLILLLYMGPTALFGTVGPKGSRDFGPFHIKPKAHAEEEEVPEDE